MVVVVFSLPPQKCGKSTNVYHLKKKFGVEKTLRISKNHPSNRIIPYIIQPSIFYTSFNYVQTLPVRAPQAPSKEESFPNHPFLDAFAVSLKKDIRIKSDVNIPLQKMPQSSPKHRKNKNFLTNCWQKGSTPPKFNIASEKWWLEGYFCMGMAYFQGLC